MTVSLGFSTDHFEKRGAGHTAREISHQPAVWRETGEIVSEQREAVDAFLRPLLGRPDLRVVLTGAGTSAFAGEILAPALARSTGRRVEAVATTDIVSNPGEYLAEDVPTLLVSFARSGNSPESVAATEIADRLLAECHHLVLTCDPDGRLYRDHAGADRSLALLMPGAANDQGFAMTSSFTSMILAAWLVLGNVPAGGTVDRLASAAERLLSDRHGDACELASGGYERVVYLGSGPLKGLARESALKLLELTAGAVVTYFDSPMGFRHGPKSVLDESTLVVVYVSGDSHTRLYDLDLLAEVRRSMRRPGSVIAVTATPGVGTDGHATWLLEGLEGMEDATLALPFVLVAQMIGLYISLDLGFTPDNPFPDKEVNRVVQGVTIHPLEADHRARATEADRR
jgi:tagatose-6-phosphate ketose/aldose isomerase